MKLALCLPGKDFTGEFLDSMVDTLLKPPPEGIRGQGIEFFYSRSYMADIYACRNDIVRTHPLTRTKSRTHIFDGCEYDFMMWIDSDMQWKGQDILNLVNHDVDIVSGVAPLGAIQGTCLGSFTDNEQGRKRISYYSMRGILEETRDEKGLVEVEFAGFGFICVKRGVFEKIGYPWFQTYIQEFDHTRFATSEDIGFCLRAGQEGFKVMVDPEVRVGHKKEVLLRADQYEYKAGKATV